jgi:hypothetical protein
MGTNHDDNYTGGLKVEIITNALSLCIYKLLKKPQKWLPASQTFSVSATGFTPDDLTQRDIILGKRPYASYRSYNLGAAFLKDTVKRFSFELSFGAVGVSIIERVQNDIHPKFNWPKPQGWHHQIADSGTFAFNLKADYALKLGKKNANKFFKLFGDNFKAQIDIQLKASNTETQAEKEAREKNVSSMEAFIEIGHLRNILVHSNFADYNYDQKTTDEIFQLFQKAEPFIEYLQQKLE